MKLVLIYLSLIFGFDSHVLKRQAVNDVFQDVVRQKTRGNQIQQCPCVIHPESRQCISYDSRYIAVSYEEAILSFLDLSKHHGVPSPLINSNTFSCQTQECQQCFSFLYRKLGEIGLIESTYKSSINVLPQNQLNPSLCPRYNFHVPAITPVAPTNVPNYLQSLISAGKQYRSTISPPSSRSTHSNPPASSPQNNNDQRNPSQQQQQHQNQQFNSRNNQNQNSNRNQNPNQNQNRNQNFNQNQNHQPRQNFNQNQNNNQLQNQRNQFRNNQAMRNRFNAQQRANNAFQPQRQFRQGQNFQRPWQNQQQEFQQVANPRPFQNFNGVQQRWNGRFWEPASQAISEVIRNPIQNSVNGWGQQSSGGGFAQPVAQFQPTFTAPAPTQAAPAPVAPQPAGWGVGGAGDGFGTGGGGAHFGNGWGSGGSGQNQDNHGLGNLFAGFGGFKKRYKRAAPATVIGKRFTINCMARGDSEDEMLALCGSCWTWRQLPDNYFPRIINELSCKPDDYCLSGWGECVQQYRNVDVLRRDNGRWVPTVITTSTCCDCRVRAGTEIHSLVIGDKH